MKKPKIIYSIWSTPSKKNRKFYLNFYSYFLSALMMKKYGYEVELYCDPYSYKYYKEIPYNQIYIIDFDKDNIHPLFWMYSKIKAIGMQTEPFIHLDGDVIFMKDIIGENLSKIQKQGVIVQMIEDKNTLIDAYSLYAIQSKPFKKWIPEVNWDKYDHNGYNCGVIGFYDMKLKDKYVNDTLKHIRKIQEFKEFKIENFEHQGLAIITEQMYLHILLNDLNIKPYEILDYNLLRNLNWDMFGLASKLGYVHLWVDSKYRKDVIVKLKNRIKNDFPENKNVLENYDNSVKDKI